MNKEKYTEKQIENIKFYNKQILLSSIKLTGSILISTGSVVKIIYETSNNELSINEAFFLSGLLAISSRLTYESYCDIKELKEEKKNYIKILKKK